MLVGMAGKAHTGDIMSEFQEPGGVVTKEAIKEQLAYAVVSRGGSTGELIDALSSLEGVTFESARDTFYRLHQEGRLTLDPSWNPQLGERYEAPVDVDGAVEELAELVVEKRRINERIQAAAGKVLALVTERPEDAVETA